MEFEKNLGLFFHKFIPYVTPGHRGDPKNNLDYGKKKKQISDILFF
jgi:hypothetical protein